MVPGGFSKMPVQDIHVHRHDKKCEARQRSCCSHHIEGESCQISHPSGWWKNCHEEVFSDGADIGDKSDSTPD